MFFAASTQTHAQGTLVYDQQSTNPPSIAGDYLNIQEDSPLLQSFTPSFSTIGFAQFEFWDFSGTPNNGNNGATVYVNLWTGSPNTNSATFVSSTTPVFMPEGFGEFNPGVTNFYFSTPITLTVGQTYYLQPVVQSGDDPWDIFAPGNTYPNGQLFERGIGFSGDLWFREGIVSVPEPTTLALIGLSGLLGYAFKRRSKLFILLAAGVLLFCSTYAQTFITANNNLLAVQSAPPDTSIVSLTAEASGLQLVSPDQLPRGGTFWLVMAGGNGCNILPMPCPSFFDPNLPIYDITGEGQQFLVDGTVGSQPFLNAMLAARMGVPATAQSALTIQANAVANLISQVQANAEAQQSRMTARAMGMDVPSFGDTGDGSGFQPAGSSLIIDTNRLWLEIEDAGTNVLLILHQTSDTNFYQINSTTNLVNTNWDAGDLQVGDWDSDQTWFWPIAKAAPVTFYIAHHADAIMQVWDVQDSQEPTNSTSGRIGIVGFQNGDDVHNLTNDLKVYYTLGGTARNGIDYTNLPGVLTLAAGMKDTNIIIQPAAMGLQSDKTIVLTLLQNSNYLIDPDYAFATNTLVANPQVYPIANGDDEREICPNTARSIDLSLYAGDPLNLPLTYAIQTWPTHGTLDTSSLPYVTYYAPTNCYEGQDSFTFTANDGQHTSAPATVTLEISSGVSAYPVTAQTCRGTPVGVWLNGWDYCGTVSYALLSNPLHGTVTNVSGQATDPNYIYTPSGTNFTGMDSFNYQVTDECGYSAMNTVTITVGNAQITPNSQTLMTGTNQPVAITLSGSDNSDSCTDGTNYYTYAVTNGPSHGTLSGSGVNRVYLPNLNYEGLDSFQFIANDGSWTSANSAADKIYVVAGPILTTGCNPFRVGPSVELDWMPDAVVQQLEQQYNFINDYKLYRSAVSGGPYTCIYTNTDFSQMSYIDTNVVAGQTNYYVATFEPKNGIAGLNESPRSSEVAATGHNPNDLIAPDATWDVWDVTPNQPRAWKGNLQAPFGHPADYATQYPTWPPLVPVSTNWSDCYVWSNSLTLNLANYTSQQLSNVVYSIAIDNNYQLYVNGQLIDTVGYNGGATWLAFKPLNALGNLVAGTNTITAVISGDCDGVAYFSMVATTNTCGR